MNIVLILMGLFTIVATILRLPFFWSSRKALRTRRLLGDTVTTLLYIGIGIMILVMGLFNIIG